MLLHALFGWSVTRNSRYFGKSQDLHHVGEDFLDHKVSVSDQSSEMTLGLVGPVEATLPSLGSSHSW